MGEQGLPRGAPLQHPRRGPAHLHPELQDGVHLGPHGAAGAQRVPVRGRPRPAPSLAAPAHHLPLYSLPGQSPVGPLLAWSEVLPPNAPGIEDLGKQAADQSPEAQEPCSTPGGEDRTVTPAPSTSQTLRCFLPTPLTRGRVPRAGPGLQGGERAAAASAGGRLPADSVGKTSK